jgi:hypothetical protein
MKKLLLLPILLITCFCFAQDAKEIIGKPIKIGNLLVAQNDFPNVMNWNDAKLACQNLGKGWRLPSKTELNILYKNRKKIGGFMYLYYWSSTKIDNYDAWVQFFDFGAQNNYGKEATTNVRAVRSL